MTDVQVKLVADEADLKEYPSKVLCVDDEIFNLEILETHLQNDGYDTLCAEHGETAWQLLLQHKNEIDLILLDRMMPELDGLTLLKRIKAEDSIKHIPVIMQTAMVGDDEAVEGIEAGAYYYVTKPYTAEMLLSVVGSALKDSHQIKGLANQVRNLSNAIDTLYSAKFTLKDHNQAREVATYLAQFSREPQRVIVGLTALISNAIEHGNLGIGRELKSELLLDNSFDAEVTKRMKDNTKKVIIDLHRNAEKRLQVTIKDEGNGFKWKEYIDFDPTRMTEPNGRGIAMANIMNPKSIFYNDKGNEVTYILK